MAGTSIAERAPATPEEIWEILRRTAEKHEQFEAAAAKRWEEDTKRWEEETRRREEAERQEVKRREEAEQQEAKRREEQAKRWDEYERQREKDRQEWEEIKKRFDETREIIAGNDGKMSRLGHSLGDVVEHLVAPGMEERFEELGMNLRVPFPPTSRKIKENGNTIAQVDLQLENDEIVMIVEVKTRVNMTHIDDHVTRLEKLRGWYDRQNDRRKLYGAIAGAVFREAERKAARKEGFYVVVQAGDTMKLDIPEGFTPREW